MEKELAARLTEIADELRAIAVNGLHWGANEYDKARYEQTLALSAELLSVVDTRSAEEIEREYRGDLTIRSPFVGVEAAIFDAEGRMLLVQRSDNARWCMPGGLADVGESASEGAEREAWEETGLRVEARKLIGVYDSRKTYTPGPVHLYHIVFLCEQVGGELTLTNETLAYGYFTEEEVAGLPVHRGHVVRIPEAFRVYRNEVEGGRFQ